MPRRTSKHPTELELEILKILWRDGPSTVRAVREALAANRDLAVTTVTTMMNIMVDKDYLSREKEGGAYVYRPTVSRKATARRILKDLLGRVFDGSASALVLNLLEMAELDEKEIEELREIVDRKTREIGQ